MLLSGRTLFHVHPDLQGQGTWPEAFGKAGYTTFLTGKWHNDGTPELYGYQVTRRVFKGGMGPHEKDVADDRNKLKVFSSELYAKAAIEQIKGNPKTPWFMMVAFTAPHDPRTPPGKYKTMYDPAAMPLPPNYMPEHPFDTGEMVVRTGKVC